MRLADIEFDETEIVVKSLKGLLDSFMNNISDINETGLASGYASWEDPEEDKKEIEKEILAIKRVLVLYGN